MKRSITISLLLHVTMIIRQEIMARLIQNEIKRVLADEILFGKLQNGGKVEVDESEGRLVFSYSVTNVPAVASPPAG